MSPVLDPRFRLTSRNRGPVREKAETLASGLWNQSSTTLRHRAPNHLGGGPINRLLKSLRSFRPDPAAGEGSAFRLFSMR